MTHDLGAVAETVCLMPGVREIPDDQIRDVAIVFHNQDIGHARLENVRAERQQTTCDVRRATCKKVNS